jgi:hypothetical protein
MHLDPFVPVAVIVAVRVGWRLLRTYQRGGSPPPSRRDR